MPTRIAKYTLAPLLIAQGLSLRKHGLKLPEPPGPRHGTAGHGPDLRLLIAGDSSAAGVGAPHQSHALSGQLVQNLSPHFRLHWQLEARTGDTTARTVKRLRALPAARIDAAVLALGVNDVTSGMRRSSWLKQQENLLRLLKTRFGVRRIYVSGLPPVGQFPLLPATMRWVLGGEANRFDAALQALCDRTEGARHVAFQGGLRPEQMAEDGFHPGTPVYAAWASVVTERILEDFARQRND